MSVTPLDDLTVVLSTVGDLVGGVRHDQWSASTPCTEWDVRALVNHMVLGHHLFTGILRGEAAVAPDLLDPTADDVLGDDPTSAYRGAAEDLLAAFGQPGVLEQVFHIPVGAVPGVVAVHLRTVEGLVHGWDLSQATGQQLGIPDDVVERHLDFTREKLADVPPGQMPVAAPQPVSDHAPPLDRLAALLGRSAYPRR